MKCIKRLLAVLLSTMIISTSAFADVPNKVAVIGDKAFDLEYINDPKNLDEIRELLSQGNKIMVKVRDQWYNNNGEIKAGKYAPFKMMYKNLEGEVKEIATAYFEKQSSVVVGVMSLNEVMIKFNGEIDKAYLSKDDYTFNGKSLGEGDELIIDEKSGVVTIKFKDDMNLKEKLSFAIGKSSNEDENVEKSVRVITEKADLDALKEVNEFYDLAIFGDDLVLDLSSVEGNVFVNGKNIEIKKLKTDNLQVSENSKGIVVKESKVENLTVPKGVKVDIQDSEVAKTNGVENTGNENANTNTGTSTGGSGGQGTYVSPWVNVKVENIEFLNFNKMNIQLNLDVDEDETNGEYLKNKFIVTVNNKRISLRDANAENGKINLYLDYKVGFEGNKFVTSDRFNEGDEVKIEYLGGRGGMVLAGLNAMKFDKTVKVTDEFKHISQSQLTVDDPKFPGEVIGNDIISFVPKHEGISHLMESFISGLLPENTRIDFLQGFEEYVLFIAQDGSIRPYRVVEKLQHIEFESENDKLMKVGAEENIEIINKNGMKLDMLVINEDVIEATLKDNIISAKANKEGVARIFVRGIMVRSDNSMVVDSETLIYKDILVIPEPVEVVMIESSITMVEEEEYKLEARVYPKNATNQKLQWSSTDEEIATVNSDGVVTAIKAGTVGIIAKASNGVKGTCEVTVLEKIETIEVTVNDNQGTIKLEGITKEEIIALVEIENKLTGNIVVFNKYNLVEGNNEIKFELDKGTYTGYMKILGREKFKIVEFKIDIKK